MFYTQYRFFVGPGVWNLRFDDHSAVGILFFGWFADEIGPQTRQRERESISVSATTTQDSIAQHSISCGLPTLVGRFWFGGVAL